MNWSPRQAFTDLKEKSSLVREALKALIERESARRLARPGGSEPPAFAAAAGVILVDTSVWVAHLRAADRSLPGLLDANLILTHPFVIAELALGDLQQRKIILAHDPVKLQTFRTRSCAGCVQFESPPARSSLILLIAVHLQSLRGVIFYGVAAFI